MIKSLYSKILFVIGFVGLMLTLASVHLNAGPLDRPNDSSISVTSSLIQTDIKGLNQSESPGLLAQDMRTRGVWGTS